MAPAPRARAAPVGGWYRDGLNWVHVEIKLVITDVCTDGLRGSGRMSTADVMVVYFDHRPHVRRERHIQPNGDIEWDNNKKWVRHEGAWPAPVASYDYRPLVKTPANHFDAHGTSTGVQLNMKKSRSCHF